MASFLMRRLGSAEPFLIELQHTPVTSRNIQIAGNNRPIWKFYSEEIWECLVSGFGINLKGI